MHSWNRELELKIVRKLVAALLAAGHRLSVSLERGFDPDEMLLGSVDKKKIVDAIFSGDDCHVFIHRASGPLLTKDQRLVSQGWVFLVIGNGCDIISDYTTNLEAVIEPATTLANRYAGV